MVSLAPQLAALTDAFALPSAALVRQSIAKKLLAGQGAPTATDKRLIRDAIDKPVSHAVPAPGTVSVAASTEGAQPAVAEIALLAPLLKPGVREARGRRVVEPVHRAIRCRLLLATQRAAANGDLASLSIAGKPSSQADAGRWVLAGPVQATRLRRVATRRRRGCLSRQPAAARPAACRPGRVRPPGAATGRSGARRVRGAPVREARRAQPASRAAGRAAPARRLNCTTPRRVPQP